MRDLPLLRKDIQIPINRSAADSRVFCTDGHGVPVPLPEQFYAAVCFGTASCFRLPSYHSISSSAMKNPDFPPLSMSRYMNCTAKYIGCQHSSNCGFWQQISCRFPPLSNETESDILKIEERSQSSGTNPATEPLFSCLYKQSDKRKEITL